MPTLRPPLMPLTTRSGRRGQNSAIASFTQSAGLPSTAQPRRRSPSKTSLAISGLRNVIEWPTPLCSMAGATTVTSPRRDSSRSIAARPGAIDAVVVGEQNLHECRKSGFGRIGSSVDRQVGVHYKPSGPSASTWPLAWTCAEGL